MVPFQKSGLMAYAPIRPLCAPARPAGEQEDSPLISIVIGGLGIGATGTADAFAKLPATVTFALAPYGADLEKLAERARADEHEVVAPGPNGTVRLSGQRSRSADFADLADIRTEYRPVALADEPLSGLCRD